MKKRVAAFLMVICMTVAGVPVSTYAEQQAETEIELESEQSSEKEMEMEEVDMSEDEIQEETAEDLTTNSAILEETEESAIVVEDLMGEPTESDNMTEADEQEKFVQENISAIADGVYTIRSRMNSSFVVDVSEGKTEDGANVQLYNDNGTKAQVWNISHDTEGYVVLQNAKSGKALDVRSASAINGANVWQYTANGTDAQRWIAVRQQDGSIILYSALNTEYVLDLKDGAAKNNQNLQLYQANQTKAQQWVFQTYNETDVLAENNKNTIADGIYSIRSQVDTRYALDVVGGGIGNGANVQLYQFNGTKAQAWRVSHDEKGYVTFVNVKSGKALDVKSASAANGTNVWQYDANGTAAQKWIAIKQQNGGIVLYSALNPTYVLDVDCGVAKNSQNVQLYCGNGTKAQQWNFQTYDESEILASENRNAITDGMYSIRSRVNSEYALDVAGGGTGDGANVQLYQYNGTKAQVWKVSHDSKGYVTFTNVKSGKVLDIKGGGAASGTNVQQYAKNDTKAQKWIAVKQSDGSVEIVSALNPELVLDLSSGMAENCRNVQIYKTNASNAQKWMLQEYTTVDELAVANKGTIGSGIYAIRTAVNQSYTLDVKSGSSANGANVQVYGYNRTNAQVWQITEDSCGFLTIINYKSGKVLDVKDGRATNNANVQQYDANGSRAQKWIAIRQSDGSVKIVSALNPQLCLDLNNGTVANGQNIQIYTSNNTKAQRWFVTGARPLQASPLNTKVVVLDPGHNAKFTGAYYYNRQEHVMTLKVAQACKTYLESHYSNIEVYMTRDTAAPLGNTIGDDLWARVELADHKNADILVSMHFNALNGSQDGALCFVSGQQNVSSQCQKLGNAILGKLQGLGLRNRGNQVTASKDYPGEDYYAINRLSARYGIPGIIVEHCFMDNAHDQIYIQSDTALQRLGYADAQGIAAYFGQ